MPASFSGAAIRRIVIEQSYRAGVGHIGSGLSVSDLLAVLYSDVLRADGPDDPERDRFVLSKGHAALALLAALWLRRWIDDEQLDSFCGDDTLFGVHPEHEAPGIDFSTGSLGHGLSMAVGAALGARIQGSERRCYVLLSDAECNSGALYEAAMFAAHHGLSNLTAIVDVNGQQATGYTRDVIDLGSTSRIWAAFGWQVIELDGHDEKTLREALTAPHENLPRVLVAHTVFGKGVPFMESRIEWHYLPMTADQYREALRHLDGAG